MAATFGFTHVRLLVSDLKACFRFYRDVLEFDVLWGDDEGSYASFKTDRTILALFKRQAMAEAIGSADKPSHVDCQDRVALIFEVDDVDVAYQRLRDTGITFLTEPLDRPDWGIRAAHFRDPDGNLIEIYNNLDA
jgi:catechol 2,3-dioxygenase-like lactoylglutathione lyase family enzyme